MQKGEIVEQGSVGQVIGSPQHPYTQRLLDAVPKIDEVMHPAEVKDPANADTAPPIVTVSDLSVEFSIGKSLLGRHSYMTAVDSVSLEIPRGSFFGIVGESGSGKTTTGRSMLRVTPISKGSIRYNDGEVDYDIGKLNRADMKDYRKRAQLIFQDPYAALSPRMTVRDIIAEPLEVMGITKSRKETDARVREIAAKCKLDLEHLRRFPHAFRAASGSGSRLRGRVCPVRNSSSRMRPSRRWTCPFRRKSLSF
jgi:ABC-type microcin C transport system duplicated ATPase subunit YejF